MWTIPGPFTFDVMLPVVPAHVAIPNQTVTVHGIPITLQHVAVTPSEIQVIVRIPVTHGLPASNWNPVIRMAVGSWNSTQPSRGDEGGAAAADGTYQYHSSNSPTLAAGQWTLTIDAIDGYDPQHGPPQVHLDGPWVFHFNMP
ncbi:MAG: hypothetical protein ACR2JY_23635 [Chloroflexota bacterium]